MPVQTPQWMDVLCCCICYNVFDGSRYQPVSLVCTHTACRACLLKLKTKQCPFDQSAINIPVSDLPQNSRILKILDLPAPSLDDEKIRRLFEKEDGRTFKESNEIMETLCIYLKRAPSEKGGSIWSPQLTRPMQRKLISLLCCNLIEPEGRNRAIKSARSLGERCLTELLLLHQNPYHLSSNLWATVRARGCQFLGPAMQEEVLKLVLLALSEGALISRKVLVMYIVQTLEKEYPQASKTSVGHVVQLLYRASCFNVIKRDSESSLMQLKEEFRTYESLRREHDAQIVQIAMEAGLRISPDQWSALLYGDQAHKSHMQSIIDRLQSPQSFCQCIQELLISLQRTGDPGHLVDLRTHFEFLADVDVNQGESVIPSWPALFKALQCVKKVVDGQVKFCDSYGGTRNQRDTAERNVVAYKFKTSMCRDIGEGKSCMRGESCTFAHSLEEMDRYRARSRLMGYRSSTTTGGSSRQGSAQQEQHQQQDPKLTPADSLVDLSNEQELEWKPPNLIAAWNATKLNSYEFDQPLRKPFLRQSTFDNTPPQLSPVPAVPPPPPPPLAPIPQLLPAQMTPPVISAPPAMATVLATPTAVMATGNIPLQSTQFPLAPANLPAAPFSSVRYQIIRAATALPAPQTSPPIPAGQLPINTAPAEFGYYFYPPGGSGTFPSRASVSGEFLHLEVPLARVVPLAQSNLQQYNEFYGQQPLTPTLETFYMYPQAGIPLRYDDSLAALGAAAAANAAGPAIQTNQLTYSNGFSCFTPVQQQSNSSSTLNSIDFMNNWSSSSSKGTPQPSSSADQDKKGKLQLLGKKREEILSRLSLLRNCADTDMDEDSANDIVHRIATSVLHDDFEFSRAKLSSIATNSGESNNNKSRDCSAMMSSSAAAWNFYSSAASNANKETLATSLSAPHASRSVARRNSLAHRSVSSEDDEKRRSVSLELPGEDLYSPWRTKALCDAACSSATWNQSSNNIQISSSPTSSLSTSNDSSCSVSSSLNSKNTAYYAASRPYIPDDYIDIKHLSYDVLHKELEQLPAGSKRAYYVKLELELRERDCWRSDDDIVIPFSGDLQVSRYGPIARSRVGMTMKLSAVANPLPSTTSLPSETVHVKDVINQPLPSAVVQPAKDQPVASRESVDPSTIVSTIPIVFQASTTILDPATVGEKLDRVVEINEKLDSLPVIDATSSVEREHLKIDLDIINKEIASLDKDTEEEYLLKELENVNLDIEELQK